MPSREEMIADLLASSLQSQYHTDTVIAATHRLTAMPDPVFVEVIQRDPAMCKHALNLLASMIQTQRATINDIQEMWLAQGDKLNDLCDTILKQ